MQDKLPLSPSQFYMWRCLLAISWEDGNCDEKEVAYFAKVFDNLPRSYALTQQQRDTLAHDLETPGEAPEAFFPYITDPAVRETLVLYAHDLIKLDGRDPDADAIMKRLKLWQHPSYDREQLRTEFDDIVARDRQQDKEAADEILQKMDNASPLFAALDKFKARLGIKLDE